MTLHPRTAKRLAVALAVFHAGLAIFGIMSIPLMWYFPALKLGVLYFALTVLVSWIIFWDCPITMWEKKLRARANPKTTYHTTFLRYYLKQKLRIPISEKSEELVAVVFLIAMFVVSLT